VLGIVGGVGLILGSLGPWITARTPFGTISANGTEGDGTITLILGITVVVMSAIPSSNTGLRIAIGLVAGLAALVGLYELVNINQRAEEIAQVTTIGLNASAGWGVWLTLAGGVVAVDAPFGRR
jgi:hypothetical protein